MRTTDKTRPTHNLVAYLHLSKKHSIPISLFLALQDESKFIVMTLLIVNKNIQSSESTLWIRTKVASIPSHYPRDDRSVKMIESSENIEFRDYADESQLEHVMKLVTTDLSEPYSSTCTVLVGSKVGAKPPVTVWNRFIGMRGHHSKHRQSHGSVCPILFEKNCAFV